MLDYKHHNTMKPFVRRLLGAVISAAVLYSCASVGRLEGGSIDEEPPRFVTSSPLPGALTASGAAAGNKGERQEGSGQPARYAEG